MREHSAKVEAGDQVFSDAYFCRFRQLFMPLHFLFLTPLLIYSGEFPSGSFHFSGPEENSDEPPPE